MARHVDRKCISDGKHRDVIACVIPALNLIYLCTHTFVLVWQKFSDSSPRSKFQDGARYNLNRISKKKKKKWKKNIMTIIVEWWKVKFHSKILIKCIVACIEFPNNDSSSIAIRINPFKSWMIFNRFVDISQRDISLCIEYWFIFSVITTNFLSRVFFHTFC